jgi:hypothetical protein
MKRRFVFVVQTEPAPGRDREYNQWYDEIHLKDVCAFPGFVGARRFRLVEGDAKTRYLALYELETDDPRRDLAALTAAAGTDRMRMTDALDLPKATTALFEQISEYAK